MSFARDAYVLGSTKVEEEEECSVVSAFSLNQKRFIVLDKQHIFCKYPNIFNKEN